MSDWKFSWKAVYEMILANNAKGVCSHFWMWQGQFWATGKGKSSPPNVYHWIVTTLNYRSHGCSYNPLGH